MLKKLAKEALNSAKKDVYSACFCFGYQPKMPEQVKKLKKSKVR